MVELKYTDLSLPWTCERQDQDSGDIYYAIHDAKYGFITNVHESKDAAEFLVRAVNCHADLVAALDDCPLPSTNGGTQDFYRRFYDWYSGAREAAIAKARAQ